MTNTLAGQMFDTASPILDDETARGHCALLNLAYDRKNGAVVAGVCRTVSGVLCQPLCCREVREFRGQRGLLRYDHRQAA